MKKVLSFVIVLAMALSMTAIPAMAAETEYIIEATGTGTTATVTYEYTEVLASNGECKTLSHGSFLGYDGEKGMRQVKKKGSNVTFKPAAGKLAGYYTIDWWNIYQSDFNCSENISYEIVYDGGLLTKTGSFEPAKIAANADGTYTHNWYTLGDFYFTGNGKEYVKFTEATTNANDNILRADAVRFTAVTNPDRSEVQIAIDTTSTIRADYINTDEFIAESVKVWEYRDILGTERNHNGNTYALLEKTKGAKASVEIKPVAGKIVPGLYEAYWYNAISSNEGVERPNSLGYTVEYAGGEEIAKGSFNPQTATMTTTGGTTTLSGWLSLGKFYFTGNGSESITITKSDTTKRFLACAAKFVPVTDGYDVHSLYATATVNGEKEVVYPIVTKGADGTTIFRFEAFPEETTYYTLTATAAAGATVKIDDLTAQKAELTTESAAYDSSELKVHEITVTNGSNSSEAIVFVNRGAAVTLDTNAGEGIFTENSDEKGNKWDASGLVGYDGVTKTRVHSGKGANCQWFITDDILTAGTHKLQFYNIYYYDANNTSADQVSDVDFVIATYEGEELVKKTVNVNLRELANAAGKSEWITIGEFTFSGREGESVKIIRNDETSDSYYLRVNAIRFTDPDVIVGDYGIYSGGAPAAAVTAGSFSGMLTGYNLNTRAAVAKLVIAKYDKESGQLKEVKFDATAEEVTNSVNLAERGKIEIATPVVSVAYDENVTLKVFVWTDGTLVPIYDAVEITTAG